MMRTTDEESPRDAPTSGGEAEPDWRLDMKHLTALSAIVAVSVAVIAGGASAARPAAPGRGPFALWGPGVIPEMTDWTYEAALNVPLAPVSIWVGRGGPEAYDNADGYGMSIYLPTPGVDGWTTLAVHGLLLHELGHIFDFTKMTTALRITFMQDIGIYPRCTSWWQKCLTPRWVSGPSATVNIPPGEMFAEEYAACALGLTQRGYQDAGFDTYGWVPPQGTDESQLCGLIRDAVTN